MITHAFGNKINLSKTERLTQIRSGDKRPTAQQATLGTATMMPLLASTTGKRNSHLIATGAGAIQIKGKDLDGFVRIGRKDIPGPTLIRDSMQNERKELLAGRTNQEEPSLF